MNKSLKYCFFFTWLFWGVLVNAQIKLSVAVKSGISNIHGLNREYLYDDEGYIIGLSSSGDGDIYNYGSMFSLETSIVESLKKSKISFEQGLGIESKSYYSHPNPKYFPELDSRKTKHTFNAITFPLKIRYNLNNFFTVYAGVSNVLKLGEIRSYDYRYNLRAMIGGDAIFFKNYIIGCEYGYDITPFSKMYGVDYFYRFDVITLKLGIVF